MNNRMVEFWVGIFVLVGFASLLFLALKVGNLGFGAETVEDPGAEAGPFELEHAGVELEEGSAVVDAVTDHGADDAEVVGAGADVGPFAHLPAGSAVTSGAATGAFYTAPPA